MSESTKTAAPQKSELHLRVISAIFLALGAIGSAWWGGWVFVTAWTLLAFVAFAEWQAMTSMLPGKSMAETSVAIGFGGFLSLAYSMGSAEFAPGVLASMLICAGLVAMFRRKNRPLWAASGYIYAALLLISVLLLRATPQGFIVILFLFMVVWGADVGAYFTGRTVGGPKLAPRISPNKTWSGFFGGVMTAILAGLGLLSLFGVPVRPGHALLAALLAVASALGDLFESGMKRKFGVKDSGTLIPGHGGVLDRLDGFVFAAILACLIGMIYRGVPGGSFNPLSAF